MNVALVLTLLVGGGLEAPRWDAGVVAPGSEVVAEVVVQGPGAIEVMSSCDCVATEIVPGGEAHQPPRIRLHLRPESRLGWHRADAQIVQRGPDRTRIHRIPVTFEVESLVPALDPELVFEYGRDDPRSGRAVEELAPILVRLGLTHAVYPAAGTAPLSVRDRAGARAEGADAVREHVRVRCADGSRAARAQRGELLYFHDPETCTRADAIRTEVVDPTVARHGLTVRDLPLDRPENLRLLCVLTAESARTTSGTYAAWAEERLFVGEPEIREILPRHLARALDPRRLAATAPRTAGLAAAGTEPE
ncbi:MAG: hypothetical protein IPK07_26575 [Deltaproteobacteria bacterium]|nr:hypothetical protein [Deltaproteobacteria bacterium]